MSNVIAKIGMLESKKFGIYFLSFLLFSGCSFIDEPVRGFFKEYTETAAIERHEYAEAVAIDRYGIDCLSSEKDKEIYLYLRNPQLYDLELRIFSDLGEAEPANFSIVQNPDKISSTITLKESFLTSIECGECGRNFSPRISVVQKKYGRKFADYSFALKINSVPPVPYGAVVLVTSGQGKKYVLCLNLPDKDDVTGIHRDIKTLTIESNGFVKKRKIYFSKGADGTLSYADETGVAFTDVKNSVSTDEISVNEDEGAAHLDFEKGENPLYFFTGDDLVPISNNITYKITLEDEDGLSSTASTSVYSQKLEKPGATAVNIADNEAVQLSKEADAAVTEIIQNDDGAGYVKLILPTRSTTGLSVSSCSVVYEIYDDSATTLLGRGTVNSSMEIPVPPFECKIKAYAENPAYVPSDLAWFHVKPVCTKLFVSESGSARSEGGWGTKKKPFNKISTVLEADLFAVKTDSENTIILLSDIKDENISITEKSRFTLTSQDLNGNTAVHTITPISETSSSAFMSLGSGSSIFIDNVCIKGFTSGSGGAAFSVADARLCLTDVELISNTASEDGGVLYLSDSNSSIVLSGKTIVSSNGANSRNGAFIANKNAALSINDDSYFALNDKVYLCEGAVLYANAMCSAEKIACISLEKYPADPAATKTKLLSPSDPNPLNFDFCNSRVTVAPDSNNLEYYIVYSDNDRCGILAKGTTANVSIKLPDSVIFNQRYMKGICLSFYATDLNGNRLNPQKSSIKVKLRSDELYSETKLNEYAKITDLQNLESKIENGMIGGDKVTVELSIKISGIVYSTTQDIIKATEIVDAVTFANAVDIINMLEDSSGVYIEIKNDIEVTNNTPLLGTSSHKFNGTFDGKGHTVTLKRNPCGRTAAIADYVGPSGVVKNVVISGNYSNTDNTKAGIQTGGVAAENEGLIINCVNYLNITVKSTNDSGGIAFVNRGKIVNCANFGNIANDTNAYWAGIYGKVGGISGRNEGTGLIENCFNYGNITSTCDDDVTVATNGLPGAITGSQSGTATGKNCYWKEACVMRGSETNNEAYNSYAFKNSLLSFFWSYNVNRLIVKDSKFNETFIYSCGTFADDSSEIVAGTEQNSERVQTLTYTGNLLNVMNAYVNANNKKYRFNGTEVDLLEWVADSSPDGYPKLKF